MIRHLLCLFVAALLVIRRHDAAAWLLDLIGGPVARWQVAAFSMVFLVELAIVCSVVFAAVLAWNWITTEQPADQRKRAQP